MLWQYALILASVNCTKRFVRVGPPFYVPRHVIFPPATFLWATPALVPMSNPCNTNSPVASLLWQHSRVVLHEYHIVMALLILSLAMATARWPKWKSPPALHCLHVRQPRARWRARGRHSRSYEPVLFAKQFHRRYNASANYRRTKKPKLSRRKQGTSSALSCDSLSVRCAGWLR